MVQVFNVILVIFYMVLLLKTNYLLKTEGWSEKDVLTAEWVLLGNIFLLGALALSGAHLIFMGMTLMVIPFLAPIAMSIFLFVCILFIAGFFLFKRFMKIKDKLGYIPNPLEVLGKLTGK